MTVFLTLLIALAAALLGVAAARRGWWLHAATAAVCTLLSVYAAMFLAGSPVKVTVPVWVAGIVALVVVDVLILTAWNVHRDTVKTQEYNHG